MDLMLSILGTCLVAKTSAHSIAAISGSSASACTESRDARGSEGSASPQYHAGNTHVCLGGIPYYIYKVLYQCFGDFM